MCTRPRRRRRDRSTSSAPQRLPIRLDAARSPATNLIAACRPASAPSFVLPRSSGAYPARRSLACPGLLQDLVASLGYEQHDARLSRLWCATASRRRGRRDSGCLLFLAMSPPYRRVSLANGLAGLGSRPTVPWSCPVLFVVAVQILRHNKCFLGPDGTEAEEAPSG